MNLLVCILNYNRPDLTEALARDVLNQQEIARREARAPQVDILVANATDAHSIAAPMLRYAPRVAVMELPNRGFVPNWNHILGAWPLAGYDYIATWNNDLELKPDFFRTLLRPFANPTVGVLQPRHNSPHAFLNRLIEREVPYVEFAAPVFRRAALEAVLPWEGRFTHGWGVDIETCWRLRRLGWRCWLSGGAQARHLCGGNYNRTQRQAYLAKARTDLALLPAIIGPDWRAQVLEGFPDCKMPF